MGKTSKWLRSFLTGKKDRKVKEKGRSPSPSESGITPALISPATPKEKRRWSFRRSSSPRASVVQPQQNALTVAVAAVAAAEAAAAAAQAAAAVVRMTAEVEEAAAVKIQAYFRSCLARKALRALKGLVKLQALVRGHLVRKQATATLRCMQALITLQAKAREQRMIRMIEETKPSNPRSSTTHRKSPQENRIKNIYHENEENIKIVEMDMRSERYSNDPSRNYSSKHDQMFHQYSPAPSAITEMTPRAYSGHFEDYNSFTTAHNSPQCFRFKDYCNGDALSSYDYPLFPNYMANTKSSRAKVRSHSAPRQRPPELYERQPSGRRRVSMEASRNGVPRAIRMQRSSSHLGSKDRHHHHHEEHHQNQCYPWMAIKLDSSNLSIKESECGSTNTVMTSANYYCRSLVAGDAHGNR